MTGEEDRLESVLPLVAKHGAAVVAITNDESGISDDPDVRFEVARTIVSRAADHGIRERTFARLLASVSRNDSSSGKPRVGFEVP